MDLIFCGTPQFAVPTLEKLVSAGHEVQLVVTQPDRPRGRGMEVALSPVKQKALEFGLPITQPEKIKNNQEFRAQLEAVAPEAIIVVGYGRIIPGWMLELPKHGNINLHGSLLPKYRGAAPIQWAIAEGETVTGVTTMLLNAGLDTGDILLQEELAIKPDDTAVSIAPALAAIGAELMLETLRGLAGGTIIPRPQIEREATLAPILTKEDGRVDFRRTADADFQSPAWIPAMAGRIHQLSRQEPDALGTSDGVSIGLDARSGRDCRRGRFLAGRLRGRERARNSRSCNRRANGA